MGNFFPPQHRGGEGVGGWETISRMLEFSRVSAIEKNFPEMHMALREQFTEQLKAAMLARDAPLVSTLRMITARLKDIDIAARPKGIDKVADGEIVAMLRGMAKSRRESVDL